MSFQSWQLSCYVPVYVSPHVCSTHTVVSIRMPPVNTGGHLGPVSGLYGLRAISATSYWLWQILCQSLGNPSKLVIYLFGTLLTLSPQQLHPPTPPLSFISTSSLSSPVFPCLPPTLLSLFHFTVSRFLSPSLCILVFFSLSSLFFLPCLPLALKHHLCLSFFFPVLSPLFVPFAL